MTLSLSLIPIAGIIAFIISHDLEFSLAIVLLTTTVVGLGGYGSLYVVACLREREKDKKDAEDKRSMEETEEKE